MKRAFAAVVLSLITASAAMADGRYDHDGRFDQGRPNGPAEHRAQDDHRVADDRGDWRHDHDGRRGDRGGWQGERDHGEYGGWRGGRAGWRDDRRGWPDDYRREDYRPAEHFRAVEYGRAWQGPRYWSAPRYYGSWHAAEYRRPWGYYYHDWRAGERLPVAYYSSPYVIGDYDAYQLEAPPPGCHYVRVDNDVVLAAVTTGVVIGVMHAFFH